MFLLAISGSVLAGGMMAKRALDKVHKWEQQSLHDSLTYDMAYTEPGGYGSFSEVEYGSFASVWTGTDTLDKFDV